MAPFSIVHTPQWPPVPQSQHVDNRRHGRCSRNLSVHSTPYYVEGIFHKEADPYLSLRPPCNKRLEHRRHLCFANPVRARQAIYSLCGSHCTSVLHDNPKLRPLQAQTFCQRKRSRPVLSLVSLSLSLHLFPSECCVQVHSFFSWYLFFSRLLFPHHHRRRWLLRLAFTLKNQPSSHHLPLPPISHISIDLYDLFNFPTRANFFFTLFLPIPRIQP